MRVRGLKLGNFGNFIDKFKSHPMRVRGLKLLLFAFVQHFFVAPHAGAWIETTPDVGGRHFKESHPMRVRGLKPLRVVYLVRLELSHPMRVRGLKLQPKQKLDIIGVAPHAGAWIETLQVYYHEH